MKLIRIATGTILSGILQVSGLFAQISPGELSNAHTSLEGISNCTRCHVLGNKVPADKCLDCHTEIRDRINNNKGYHSSSEVKGKLCFSCHSEHNGKNFRLIRLDENSFDHNLTGYKLSTPHSARDCRECHVSKNITDPKLRARKTTYLGVSTECLTCHTDYHQQTLSPNCLNCHIPDTFVPASKFNHSSARFTLKGKHATVACVKCHKIETVNGNKFQEFRGLQFSNCASCHKDPHQNRFGQNCRQCHSEESFMVKKSPSGFDHNRTGFPLVEKHLAVDCKSCHKGKLTDPLNHSRCTDCHSDYHNGEFRKNGISPDCSECHSVSGFNRFSFSVDQHNKGPFPLQGAHEAVACTDCHKKQENWSFRNIGINCKDCHTDIHERIIEPHYYPGGNCKACHNQVRWNVITFDHSVTRFALTGAHSRQACRSCHFRPDPGGTIRQRFYELSANCTTCHQDQHFRQFEKNGITDCSVCHDTESWKASKFNHDNAGFRLDGKHADVACAACHKVQKEGKATFIRYKPIDYRCESCH